MNRFVFPLFALLLIAAASCEHEEDALINKPTPESICIKGVVRTPDGQPFANIPVCVDYEFRSVVAHIVKHKGKAMTDKNGHYSIFFEVGEDKAPAGDIQRRYTFTIDLSSVSPQSYLRPDEKLEFHLSVDEREGETMTCDFTMPRRKNVKVNVENSGISVIEGIYAVRNKFTYGSGWGLLDCGTVDEPCEIDLYEPIEIPANGTQSVSLPCGIGIANTIQVVYRGTDTVRYTPGLPSSDPQQIHVTDSYPAEPKLVYTPPSL